MARRKVTNTLALAVLGLLQEKPMHPYEMAATLRERGKDGNVKLNTGSLYDIVESLVRHGWIEPVATVRDGNRPERTVYAPTEHGQAEFVRWVDELIRVPVPEYPKFLAAVSYLGALTPARAAEALEERAGHLTRQIGELEEAMAVRLPRLFMIEGEFGLHALRAEREWIRRTAGEIRDGSLVWPGADWAGMLGAGADEGAPA